MIQATFICLVALLCITTQALNIPNEKVYGDLDFTHQHEERRDAPGDDKWEHVVDDLEEHSKMLKRGIQRTIEWETNLKKKIDNAMKRDAHAHKRQHEGAGHTLMEQLERQSQEATRQMEEELKNEKVYGEGRRR